jgi:hypothetical protein
MEVLQEEMVRTLPVVEAVVSRQPVVQVQVESVS